MVRSSFHLAKHEDGRWTGHIHIVIGIKVLSKLMFSSWLKNHTYSIPEHGVCAKKMNCFKEDFLETKVLFNIYVN